jgi:hypothetical protein
MLNINDIYAKELQDYESVKNFYKSVETKEYISLTKAFKTIENKFNRKISEFLKNIYKRKDIFFVSYYKAKEEYSDILDYKIHNKLKVISLEILNAIDFFKLKVLMKPIISYYIFLLQQQFNHKSEY